MKNLSPKVKVQCSITSSIKWLSFLAPFLYLILPSILFSCSATIKQPDVVFEIAGFCPDSTTMVSIRESIRNAIAGIQDQDVKNFLMNATVEDNVDPAQCKNNVCPCPGNTYRLGIWRNDVVSAADRKQSITSLNSIIPAEQTFALKAEGRFIDDIILMKWLSIDKRYSAGTKKAAPDGNIELTEYVVDYPSDKEIRLTVNGTYHDFNDPSFSISVTDKLDLILRGIVHRDTCSSLSTASADTDLLDGLVKFLVPFGNEIQQGGGLQDFLGITKNLSSAKNYLPSGVGCAAASILPNTILIPKTKAKVEFNYKTLTISPDGMFASGEILLASRVPRILSYRYDWLSTVVRLEDYNMKLAKFGSYRLPTVDMREPIDVTWTIQPITWTTTPIMLTGQTANLTIPLGTASPGDTGYAFIFAKAVDADGYVATTNLAARAEIVDCCDLDMFRYFFNGMCGDRVGANMEKCR